MNLGTPLRKMIKLLCKFIFQPLYYINPLLNTINLHIIPQTCKFLILWNALHALVSSGACSLFFAHLIMLFQGLIQFLLSPWGFSWLSFMKTALFCQHGSVVTYATANCYLVLKIHVLLKLLYTSVKMYKIRVFITYIWG